ncbi:DUF444 family protein [Zhaonella formicivorans]|uniref:DUF444 family protein n=1 Tax=Zhaonella formicivorans TaxID=2528593 RepID=UPI0010CF1F2E|nr:DUF444 family protein [Zhaonella formicivorans]
MGRNQLSDGDNLPSDNDKCLELVQKILPLCNLFCYGEIVNPYYRTKTLMAALKKNSDSNCVTVTIKNKHEVYPALRKFLLPKNLL